MITKLRCPHCDEIACVCFDIIHDIEAGLVDISTRVEVPKPITLEAIQEAIELCTPKEPYPQRIVARAMELLRLQRSIPELGPDYSKPVSRFLGIPLEVDETVREGTAEIRMSDGNHILIVGL